MSDLTALGGDGTAAAAGGADGLAGADSGGANGGDGRAEEVAAAEAPAEGAEFAQEPRPGFRRYAGESGAVGGWDPRPEAGAPVIVGEAAMGEFSGARDGDQSEQGLVGAVADPRRGRFGLWHRLTLGSIHSYEVTLEPAQEIASGKWRGGIFVNYLGEIVFCGEVWFHQSRLMRQEVQVDEFVRRNGLFATLTCQCQAFA